MINHIFLKPFLFFIVIGFSTQTSQAQRSDAQAKLPLDERIKKGVLENGGITKRLKQEATIFVYFDCNHEKAETSISIVHRKIKKLATGEIRQADLDKTLMSYTKGRKQEKKYNKYDMGLLAIFFH